MSLFIGRPFTINQPKQQRLVGGSWNFSRHRINENENYFIAFVQIFIEHQMFDFKITQDENRCVIQTKTGTYIFIAATEILLTYILMDLFNSAPAH